MPLFISVRGGPGRNQIESIQKLSRQRPPTAPPTTHRRRHATAPRAHRRDSRGRPHWRHRAAPTLAAKSWHATFFSHQPPTWTFEIEFVPGPAAHPRHRRHRRHHLRLGRRRCRRRRCRHAHSRAHCRVARRRCCPPRAALRAEWPLPPPLDRRPARRPIRRRSVPTAALAAALAAAAATATPTAAPTAASPAAHCPSNPRHATLSPTAPHAD